MGVKTFTKTNGLFHTPRSGGRGVQSHLAISILIDLELRRKHQRVGHYKTQRLIPNCKVSGQTVTSEVRPMTQKSSFDFWLIAPPKVAGEQKPRRQAPAYSFRQVRIIYVLFGKNKRDLAHLIFGRPIFTFQCRAFPRFCCSIASLQDTQFC